MSLSYDNFEVNPMGPCAICGGVRTIAHRPAVALDLARRPEIRPLARTCPPPATAARKGIS